MLKKLIDFGYFTIVARPLLWFLKLTNNVTKNFGIRHHHLEHFDKVIFLPLTQISFKSMKEMQKVQPEMARLKNSIRTTKQGFSRKPCCSTRGARSIR